MPKRGGRAGKSSAPKPTEEESHIVFGDAKSAKKKEKQKDQAPQDGSKAGQDGTSGAPPKPDTRALIGGASWTGKLPVNLLSELCQKQKWAKPEYTMSQNAEGFSSMVILKSTNLKTQETVILPPFKLPPTMKHLAVQPSAVEARHFAATYALFRTSSMKNIHMMLPPNYRDLWKNEFQTLKADDIKEGKGWLYEADPFAAKKERDQAQVVAAQKRDEREAQKAKETDGQRLPMLNGALPMRGSAKGWSNAPKVEMGKHIRADVEKLVRQRTIWNPCNSQITGPARSALTEELGTLGFRNSHAEEALENCGDREKALEWLLIYVPEDDLPKWAFPEGYTAGVSLASGNLKREAMIKRLAQGGYSPEIVIERLDTCNGDEGLAAEKLQDALVTQRLGSSGAPISEHADSGADEVSTSWNEEMATLEAIYASKYRKISANLLEMELEVQVNGQAVTLQVRKSSRYPSKPPILSIVSPPLPSYIKLSIVQQSVVFAYETLMGEFMVFGICDWLENNISSIVNEPGKLEDLSAATVGVDSSDKSSRIMSSKPRRTAQTSKVSASSLENRNALAKWEARMKDPAQQKMLQARKILPAWKVKDMIVRTIQSHQVTIVAGETGSGKSTQTVQFLLDDMITQQQGAEANILCTQPRRISALGLADRVSAERCSAVGDEVGYAIRGESKHSKGTKIMFMTTGVLLRRLQTSGATQDDMVGSLASVSHVVLDEVHERSLDTDFLLVLLRDVLSRRTDLKLVLMSATLDAGIFQNYFEDVGMVTIEGRTFPVEDLYLDQVVEFTGFEAQGPRNSRKGPDMSDRNATSTLSQTIHNLGMNINYDLIKALVHYIDMDFGSVITGGILVFMPGTLEINRTIELLRSMPNIQALPLHASLTPTEQRRVFPRAPPGKRKVIVATNVAETSITVEDIVAVVDTGKVKETSFDPQNNMVKLQEVWASRAACKQRRGRAGRVQEGKCYKLFTKNMETKMVDRPEPEIKRVPLEQLCLSVRAMGIVDAPGFLSRAITPPDTMAVEGAIKLLQRMGAIDKDQLTALGRHLSMIPADLRCGKLIVYGATFGCLDACLTIAAILTARNPFLSPQNKREESKAARSSFAPGQGDLICDLRAYEAWSERKRTTSHYRELRAWCDEYFLSSQTLEDISSNRAQYLSTLHDIGFIPSPNRDDHNQGTSDLESQNSNTALIRALVAGAFSPQIARIDFPNKKYAASVSGAVELDPEARTIKYFNEENGRVFIHPSSPLFSAQTFPPPTPSFLSYFTKLSTSKIFIRDLTPFNTCALLLFGGKIELDTAGRGLVVDGWVRVKGWARIGVLVSRLRGMLDEVLARKVEDPGVDICGDEVVGVVRRLVELDGMDR